jgi:hypothetical protein
MDVLLDAPTLIITMIATTSTSTGLLTFLLFEDLPKHRLIGLRVNRFAAMWPKGSRASPNQCRYGRYPQVGIHFKEELMNTTKFKVVAPLLMSLIFGAATLPLAQAQDSKDTKTPYPSMAPLDQYLMDRNAEIALAQTAAPEAISHDATILVMGRRGYETAVDGKNGFVCLVERAWMAPFENPEFWNPKNRSPVCYNPAGARSVLPLTKIRTEMVLAGISKEQIIENLKTAKAKKELPALEPGAIAYMMSKQAYLTDQDDHNVAHVMFFTPSTDPATWGANASQSPILLLQQDPIAGITTFMIPVGWWSDGTAAPYM